MYTKKRGEQRLIECAVRCNGTFRRGVEAEPAQNATSADTKSLIIKTTQKRFCFCCTNVGYYSSGDHLIITRVSPGG